MRRKVFAMLLVALVTITVFAHPGRTDSQGGHTNHSTGQYHFHHGYPEHQHTGGVCPYDYDDKTGQSSGSSSQKKTTEKDYSYLWEDAEEEPTDLWEDAEEEPTEKKKIVWEVIAVVGIVTFYGLPLFKWIASFFKRRK